MATTLRIDHALYREAKAEAARAGTTITKFIEEALRLRLRQTLPMKPVKLPTFGSGSKFRLTPVEIKRHLQAMDLEHDLKGLTLAKAKRKRRR